MNAEDEDFIQYIQKRRKYDFCVLPFVEASLDTFENMCPVKESTINKERLITASLDNISKEFDREVGDSLYGLVETVYDHWRLQRSRRSNMPLLPQLKFETGRESDDSDPYVCFRRREVRQIRKTRGRDAHVLEKLKKLRKELEDARHLVKLINQRENGREKDLAFDEQIFRNRHSLKDTKRNLGIKGDDAELIDQKVRVYI